MIVDIDTDIEGTRVEKMVTVETETKVMIDAGFVLASTVVVTVEATLLGGTEEPRVIVCVEVAVQLVCVMTWMFVQDPVGFEVEGEEVVFGRHVGVALVTKPLVLFPSKHEQAELTLVGSDLHAERNVGIPLVAVCIVAR